MLQFRFTDECYEVSGTALVARLFMSIPSTHLHLTFIQPSFWRKEILIPPDSETVLSKGASL